MIVISYDIQDDKIRGKFSRMLMKEGAIRLQYSVYEINNTDRVINNVRTKIKGIFSKLFTADDSVVIMEVKSTSIEKYGNAIHRDQGIVFL